MIIDEERDIIHYGILRRSGRYPWGSGGNEETHNLNLLGHIKELRSKGISDPDIAKGLNLSTTDFRAQMSIARNQQKQAKISRAQGLKDRGNSTSAIGRIMGEPESSVRAMLAPGAKDRADNLTNISEMLKRRVEADKWIDVGSGVENYMGISKEKLSVAVAMLKEQGYELHPVPHPQIGTGLDTRMKVLAMPGTTQNDAWKNMDKIKQVLEFSNDGGRTIAKIHDPMSINSNRVLVRYKEDGGGNADGVLYVRPGVKDVSIGSSRYAQVRVLVGDGHYLKGMAMYKDDLPTGTDIVFNTSKSSTGNKFDAMKEITKDPDLPFGAIVRQVIENEGLPNERNTSVMNIMNEEGQWKTWSKTLASQFLSKQSPALAKAQLDKTYEARKKDIDEIKQLTNPTIKKYLLTKAADAADSAGVHLAAAALPRQYWHAILPIESMKHNEIYAPNYSNGERVVLIRYPHGGTFEIPELTVNNRNRESIKLLSNAKDAVGIHPSVAHRLSGADFDGDTVLVIPNGSRRIKSSSALEGLKNFDPIAAYPAFEGMVPISKKRMQQEMGSISNLITDMTIKGAPHTDIVKAIRHSMVVIDSEKKNLNYKQSAINNGIAKLKQEYQGRSNAGAATLLSRAGSDKRIPDRKARPAKLGGGVNRTTGAKEFVDTGRTRIDKKTGLRVPRMQKHELLAVTSDAHALSSGTPMETLYANHSNKLKALGNHARLSEINTPTPRVSASAKRAYREQVDSLNASLKLAVMNRPRERQAQVVANAVLKAKYDDNPNIDKDIIKKMKFDELAKARTRLGASKKDTQVHISAKEWDAIQAGAISNHKLEEILTNTDIEAIRKLATPRRVLLMSPNKTSRAHAMLDNGLTRAEVAKALGVSLTTLDTAING